MTTVPVPMYVPKFLMRQKLTMMVNQYEIYLANPDGSEGELMAFAQQKRMAFKEEVTFFSDRGKTRPVFSFKARKKIDLNAGYDVSDEGRQPIGSFRKDFGKSLLRSTWQLSAPGLEAFGQERNQTIAVVRRLWDLIPVVGEVAVPFVFHFDFTDTAGGALVLSSERKKGIRDRYTVAVPDERVDFRLAAAMAVALDALQSR